MNNEHSNFAMSQAWNLITQEMRSNIGILSSLEQQDSSGLDDCNLWGRLPGCGKAVAL